MDAATAKEHRTVTRVVRIMEMVAASAHPLRLAAMADVLEAPKTSIYGLVKGLVATGYLREYAAGYTIGPAVSTLLVAAESPVGEAARPVLEKLRATFDETVILSAQVGSSVVYLDMVESAQFIRYTAPLRQRRPIYPTSTGKCFLAHMGAGRRAALLGEFVRDPEMLRAVEVELDLVRAEGVAYNRGETVQDVSAAAALVVVPGRSPVAVAVVGPTNRIATRFPEIAEAVRAAAGEIASSRTG
jgi:DNA-binding IclR family transcriptional regulator